METDNLFTDDIIFDDNMYGDFEKQDYYNIIIDKIDHNIKLTDIDKKFLWSFTDEFTPKTKDELQDKIIFYLNKDITELNFINTSKILSFSYLFHTYELINIVNKIDISEWDVSNVIDMNHCFYNCWDFRCDLSKWDVSNVENMNAMFYNCQCFNSNLNNWDVSNVSDMSYMFFGCNEFNSELNNWDVSNVFNMQWMFANCLNFNGDVTPWKFSNDVKKEHMFYGCKLFNYNLHNWNLSAYDLEQNYLKNFNY